MSAPSVTEPSAAVDPGFAAKPRTHVLARTLGRAERLDPLAGKVAEKVQGILTPGSVKDVLAGRWLGHALHPLLTDIPIGTWVSAVTLDLIGGRESERAAEKLIGAGLLAAAPTAWSGLSEWSDSVPSSDEVRRVGLVHAASNGTAAAFFGASLIARKRGSQGTGKVLALAGAGALGFGGWLGSHMSYSLAVGVDQTALQEGATEWRPAIPAAELPEGVTRCVTVDGVSVLVVRQHGEVHALGNRCCHRGGPLHEGDLGENTITCPWHASTFRLSDGSPISGPAAYPQPIYDVRAGADGMMEVRARGK